MALSVEGLNKGLAQVRGYSQYFMGLATAVGVMTAAQQKEAYEAMGEIVNGLSQVLHGTTNLWSIGVVVLGPMVSIALSQWSKHTATTQSQAAQVNAAVKDPNSAINKDTAASILDATTSLDVVKKDETKIVVKDEALANKVPSPVVQPAQ
jgi:hypothetical protein